MFSVPLSSPVPSSSKNGMSYCFGPHMLPQKDGIYFEGDNRIVRQPSDTLIHFTGTVPVWLVADWMLAKNRGEPISRFAEEVISTEQPSQALIWLSRMLDQ